jgi:hypothetical protein
MMEAKAFEIADYFSRFKHLKEIIPLVAKIQDKYEYPGMTYVVHTQVEDLARPKKKVTSVKRYVYLVGELPKHLRTRVSLNGMSELNTVFRLPKQDFDWIVASELDNSAYTKLCPSKQNLHPFGASMVITVWNHQLLGMRVDDLFPEGERHKRVGMTLTRLARGNGSGKAE